MTEPLMTPVILKQGITENGWQPAITNTALKHEMSKSNSGSSSNASSRPRDINNEEMKRHVAELQKASVNGLSAKQIVTLANNVVFTNGYDVFKRRKLLYSLLPEGHDFPYRIIPLAISSTAEIPVSPAWQHAILSWLGALLEFGIITPHNPYVHLCYTAVFNLVSHLNLCGLACKVLYYITLREDVNRHRTQLLMSLKTKPGFFVNVSQLLRIYRLFRPDLVVGELAYKRVVPSTPQNIRAALSAARLRLQETSESVTFQNSNSVWPAFSQAAKVNPYQRNTAIPQPDTNYYTTTVEEKKEKVIFVTQYRRFSELLGGMEDSRLWQWPNNPASHSSSPIIIPLFRPHEPHVYVGLSNWLEFALRMEVIEGFGNPSFERREKLLDVAISLVCSCGPSVPVVNLFVTELMFKWDGKSHFDKVMALLEGVSFFSPEFLSETLLKVVTRILCMAPLVTWIKVVEAVTNMVCSWALMAYEETFRTQDEHSWPGHFAPEASVVGLWFLTLRMERIFLKALIDFKCHPMVVHHILDYYVKLNMYVDVLELPMVFFPPATLTFAVVTKGDLMTTHRLGQLLSRMWAAMQRLRDTKARWPEEAIRRECLGFAECVNQSVIFFFKGVYNAKALTTKWEKVLSPFYPFHFLEDILVKENSCSFATITDALAYLPFSTKYLVESTGDWSKQEREEVRDRIIEELQEAELTGIQECVQAFKKN
ncbi:centromere protein I isoform X1 [Procambarus clarkii]|uniref:centromere protein I isoform X1 n=2 Tax=Procambarus clarkii TaxID=6728 RepID=UPI003743FA10